VTSTAGLPPLPRRWKVSALALLASGVVLDLASKAWMQNLLGMAPDHPDLTKRKDLIPGFFGLEGTWNTGVTFGAFQGKTEVILLFTGIAILGLLVWLLATRAPSRALHVALALVLAGAIGNLYDRWNWQKVRDFFLIYLGDIDKPTWKYPNFNVADSMIVCGVILILWEEMFGRRRRLRRAAALPVAAAAP
jgi:signal peptidase II